MKFIAKDLQTTKEFAFKFAQKLKQGDIVTLNGDLGAGKTTFVKFVVEALGGKQVVTSPTFTLLNEYDAKFKIFHFDMYRLKNSTEAVEAGLDEVLRSGVGICFVEWPMNVSGILPKENIKVSISLGDNGERIFEVENEDFSI